MIDIFNEKQKQILLMLFNNKPQALDRHDINVIGLFNADLIEIDENMFFRLSKYGKAVVAAAVSPANLF